MQIAYRRAGQYQKGACGPGRPFFWLNMGPFEEQLICEASQENSHEARARMLRAEGLRVPGSTEGNFFSRFYRIPCVAFSPFSWERGLVYSTTTCLKIAEQRIFYSCASFRMCGLYRDKPNNAFSSDRYHS